MTLTKGNILGTLEKSRYYRGSRSLFATSYTHTHTQQKATFFFNTVFFNLSTLYWLKYFVQVSTSFTPSFSKAELWHLNFVLALEWVFSNSLLNFLWIFFFKCKDVHGQNYLYKELLVIKQEWSEWPMLP